MGCAAVAAVAGICATLIGAWFEVILPPLLDALLLPPLALLLLAMLRLLMPLLMLPEPLPPLLLLLLLLCTLLLLLIEPLFCGIWLRINLPVIMFLRRAGATYFSELGTNSSKKYGEKKTVY